MDPEPEKPVFYLYHEYYASEQLPVVHADAVKAVGDWITGAFDPAARGRNQRDGQKIIDDLKRADLHLVPANNAVESGLYHNLQLLQAGRVKVFETLGHFKTEFRLYRRDEKGQIVKQNDHLMDDFRYLLNTANIFKTKAINLAHRSGSGRGEF